MPPSFLYMSLAATATFSVSGARGQVLACCLCAGAWVALFLPDQDVPCGNQAAQVSADPISQLGVVGGGHRLLDRPSLSSQEFTLAPGPLSCSHGDVHLDCLGSIQDKITVCATDDSYQKARQSMAQAEEETRSRGAIVIKAGGRYLGEDEAWDSTSRGAHACWAAVGVGSRRDSGPVPARS